MRDCSYDRAVLQTWHYQAEYGSILFRSQKIGRCCNEGLLAVSMSNQLYSSHLSNNLIMRIQHECQHLHRSSHPLKSEAVAPAQPAVLGAEVAYSPCCPTRACEPKQDTEWASVESSSAVQLKTSRTEYLTFVLLMGGGKSTPGYSFRCHFRNRWELTEVLLTT